MKTDIYFSILSRSFLLRMTNVSDKTCRGDQITQFVFNIFFFKSSLLCDRVEKYCRAGQATVDNTTHAHCMLNNKGYKHAIRICNT